MTGETLYVSHSEGFLPSSPDLPFKLKKSGRLYIREVKCLLIVRRDLDILVKTFSGSSLDCLKTYSGIFQDFLRAFLRVYLDSVRTFSGLSQDFPRSFSFSKLCHNFSKLSEELSMSLAWLPKDFS